MRVAPNGGESSFWTLSVQFLYGETAIDFICVSSKLLFRRDFLV